MFEEKQTSEKTTELIIQHFLLVTIVLFQAIIKLLNIVLPNPERKPAVKSNLTNSKAAADKENKYLDLSIISKKSSDELKEILTGIDIFSSLNKEEMTELIFSNKEALNIIKMQNKREALTKMKNAEIRSLLNGVDGISRFRKSQLVEMVLKQEELRLSRKKNES